MKTTKRILSMILCLAMVIGYFTIGASAEGETATLVTDISQLNVDDQVIIVGKHSNKYYALSTTQNNNNRTAVVITPNADNTITVASNVQVLTLKAGKTANTWAFYTGKGYLYAASSSKNYLRTENTLSANSSFSLSINASTGVATAKSTGTYTRNWLRLNATNTNPGPIFSCYSSGQQDIYIYKIGGSDTPKCEHELTYVPNSEGTKHTISCSKCDYTEEAVHNIKGENGTCDVCGGTVDVIAAAYALGVGETMEGTATLTGTITSIDTAWSEQHGNITVTIKIADYEDQPIQCYRMKGVDGVTDASKAAVGDVITVTGSLMRYSTTVVEFAAGCELINSSHKHVGEYVSVSDTQCHEVCTICGEELEEASDHEDETGDGKCDYCGDAICEHNWENLFNSEKHWTYCAKCDTVKGEAAHNITIEKDATSHNISCSDCAYKVEGEHELVDNECICGYVVLTGYFGKVDTITEGYFIIGGAASSANDDGIKYSYLTNEFDEKSRLKGICNLETNGDLLVNTDLNLVWKFIATEGGFYIQNAATKQYLYTKAAKAIYLTDNIEEAEIWTVTTAGDVKVALQATTSKLFLAATQYGGGTTDNPAPKYLGFAAYANAREIDFFGMTEAPAVHEHEWDDGVITTEPDCDSEGVKTFTCSGCDETKTETVPAKGHTEAIDKAQAPTCGATGLTEGKHCSVCGEVIVAQETVPATGNHSWNEGEVTKEPTYTEEGIKTFTCTVCGETKTETIEKLEQVKTDPFSATMELNDSLAMKFIVDLSKMPADAANGGYYLKLVRTYGDGRAAEEIIVPQSEWTLRPNSTTKYLMYVYTGLASNQMTDIFVLEIYNANHELVTVSREESIQAYAMRAINALENNAAKRKEATMYVDMLNYGAASQQSFPKGKGYNLNNLANSKLSDSQKLLATSELVMKETPANGEGAGKSTLALESKIEINLTFYKTKVDRSMRAVVSYKNHDGKDVELTIEGEDFGEKDAERYMITVPDLAVPDGDTQITCRIYDANGNEVTYAVDSINGYLTRAIQGGGGALYEMTMRFTQSAYAYFHT